MAQIFKDPDGNYIALKGDGTKVPVLPRMLEHGTIPGFDPVSQQQGVSTGQRFTVKNLTDNPENAKAYLDHIGFEVRPYGGGFNFAVRPKTQAGKGPWKVVDPDGFDPQDILDLTGDALSFAAQVGAGVVAAPSGPLGEAAAVGGTSAAVEAGRQALGSMAGVPNNIDPKSIATAGALGAMAVPAGRALGAMASSAGKLVGRATRETAARFAGIEGSKALSGADAMLDAADWSVAHPGQLMRTTEESADILRTAVKKIAGRPFPENALAKGMAKEAGDNGATVNMREIRESLEQEMLYNVDTAQGIKAKARTVTGQVQHGIEPSLQGHLDKTLATLHDIIGEHPWDAVPTDRAVAVKNYLQGIGRQKGLFTQSPPGNVFRKLIGEAAENSRSMTEYAMVDAGKPEYVPAMRAFERKTKLLHDWSKVLRIKDGSTEAQTARANFVRALYHESSTQWLSGVDDLESTFGVTGLKAAVREARVGAVTGQSSAEGPSLFGRGGRSTLGIGAAAFGHPISAAIELAATSPKVAMTGTKLAVRAAGAIGPAMKPSLKAGAIFVAQQAAAQVGKGVSRNDSIVRGPKRPTKIGV